MQNPIFNADQLAAERDVLAMWQTETVKCCRATVGHLFEIGYGSDTPKDLLADFDRAMDEYVTNYLFKAAVSDAAHPRFVRDFMPAYDWDGVDVPGARMGGDNPDNCYRLAGVEHGGRYRITGRPTGVEPAHTSFTLTGNYGTSVTIQTLESGQLHREEDGSFTITIDEQPANGRPNHLTTAPHAKFLFIRETFEDWSRECSFDLSIERLDSVERPRLTVEEMASRAAFRAVEDVPLYFWFQRLFSGLPVNSFRPPQNSATLGGLVTQAGIQAWYQLEPDEAVVVRYQPAGATYVSTELANWWFQSLDCHERQSSLTRAQSVIDADGWISVVIARRDPGVANWLDTGDERTVLFFLRWQGLPAIPQEGGPQLEVTKTTIVELPKNLTDAQLVVPGFREQQIAARQAAWRRRTSP